MRDEWLDEAALARLAVTDRLAQVLVRCGGCRFVAAAQDAGTIIRALEKAGDYCRDVSRYEPSPTLRQYVPAVDAPERALNLGRVSRLASFLAPLAFLLSACSPSPRVVEFSPTPTTPARVVAFPAKKPSAAVQCVATTAAGSRCKRRTTNLSGLCRQHAGTDEYGLDAAQAAETAAEHLGTCKADANECAACRALRLASGEVSK